MLQRLQSTQWLRFDVWLLHRLLTGLGSKEIDPQHIGLYYDLNKSLVPEAFQAFHQVRAQQHLY